MQEKKFSIGLLIATMSISWLDAADFLGQETRVGMHVYSDPYFRNAEIKVVDVVESLDPCAMPWENSGMISFANIAAVFSIPVLEVLNDLDSMPGSDQAIDDLLPYLNCDVSLREVPERSQMMVREVMSMIIYEQCFEGWDRFRDKPIESYLKVYYSRRTSAGELWVLQDGTVFFEGLGLLTSNAAVLQEKRERKIEFEESVRDIELDPISSFSLPTPSAPNHAYQVSPGNDG